jgi:hypothetical protein
MATSPVNVSGPPLHLATAFHAPGFVLSCEFLSKAGSSSIAATPRSQALLQLAMRMALAHALG